MHYLALGPKPDSVGFVPEPSTALLLGLGLTGLGMRRRAQSELALR